MQLYWDIKLKTLSWVSGLTAEEIGIISIILMFITIIFMFFIPKIEVCRQKRRNLGYHFEFVWKKVSSLRPTDLMRKRGTREEGFYSHSDVEVDEPIRKKILANQNFIVTGKPLSGKTRAVYEALINSRKPLRILVPRVVDIDLVNLDIPKKPWRGQGIIIFDDIEKYARKQTSRSL